MYMFGAWVTKEVIAAECDAEAVYDADATFATSRLGEWKYGVALFCGNRKVKEYIPVSHDPESMKYLRIARELNPAKFQAKYMNI